MLSSLNSNVTHMSTSPTPKPKWSNCGAWGLAILVFGAKDIWVILVPRNWESKDKYGSTSLKHLMILLLQACWYPGRITHKLYTTSNPLQHVFFVKCDFLILYVKPSPSKRIKKNLKKNIHHTSSHDFGHHPSGIFPSFHHHPLEVLEASFTRSFEVTSSPKVPVPHLIDGEGFCEDDSG